MTLVKKLCLSATICLAVAACKSSKERAEEHYQNGLELVAAGDTDRALVEFRNTLKLAEGNMDARRQMALIFMERGNKKAAYRNYLHVVEKLPNDLEGRTALSMLAFEARNWDEFERHGKVAVEQSPDSPQAKAIDVGMRYRAAVMGKDLSARSSILDEAEELNKSNSDSPILRQVLIDGYVTEEKFDDALVLIDQTIEANPKDMQLYTNKLELLARNGDEAGLEAELRKMIELFPNEESPKSTLLRYLVSRQRMDDAEALLRQIVKDSPPADRNDALIALSQFLQQTKGPDVALAELDKELEKDPDQDALRALRAAIVFDSGKKDEAIAEMQKIASAPEPNLSQTELQNVKVTLAKMLVSTGNEVGARKLIEEVLQSDANAVNALKMQANWLISDDDTDGAIRTLRTALDQSPQDVEAITLMAQAYQRSGNSKLMMEFLAQAVEASNKAPEPSLRYAQVLSENDKLLQAEGVLISSLRISPGNVSVLTALGQVYLGLDDIPRARQVMETLYKMGNKTASNNANALKLEILDRESGSEEAAKFLSELAQQGGDEGIAAQLALIRGEMENGNAEAALADMKALSDKHPNDMRLRNALALSYASARKYDEALAVFEKILEDNPELVSTWLQMARLQSAKGDMDAARATIDKGLEAAPDAPDLLWGKASYLQNEGDIEGAIEIYEALYKTSSQSPIVANNLASLLATYRDDEDSLSRARTIARRLKDIDVGAFQDTYGWILYRSGEVEEAIKYLEPAAKELERDESVQYHLGMAYAAAGRRDAALEQLRKAVTLAGPLGEENKLIVEARKKIEELEGGATDGETPDAGAGDK